jgi:hypothetical protein
VRAHVCVNELRAMGVSYKVYTHTVHTQTARKHSQSGSGIPVVSDALHTHSTGVSYMFPNDDVIYAHISSKFSSDKTSSKRFQDNIVTALADMKATIEQHMAAVKAKKSS